MVHPARVTPSRSNGPLPNRVQPTGELSAHPARGLFMGNRGRIHRPDRTLGGRRWSTHAWITCTLCFRGRHRQVWGNSYTELFFLDEAVALAAGHRPCAECRHADYRRWQVAWQTAHSELPTAPAMNARLHADRIDPMTRRQRRHMAAIRDLPDGCFVLIGQQPALRTQGKLLRYTPSGYDGALTPVADAAIVLTPRATLGVLRAGYRPVLHPSSVSSSLV